MKHRASLALLLIVCAVGVAFALSDALVTGTTQNPTLTLAPDPQFAQGKADYRSQYLGVVNSFIPWPDGNANQLSAIAVSVPHPSTGRWNSVFRLQPRRKAGTGWQWDIGGYELGSEGRYANGFESDDRFYLWSFARQQTLMFTDKSTKDTMVFGQVEPDKRLGILATKFAATPQYYAVKWNADGTMTYQAGVTSTYPCGGPGTHLAGGICVQN